MTVGIAYHHKSPFVKADIQQFKKHHYDVIELDVSTPSSIIKLLFVKFIEFFTLIRQLPKCQALFIWFNDYHSLMPVILAKVFRVPSTIIVGGFDGVGWKENNHGIFASNPIRKNMAVLAYKWCDFISVVDKSLAIGDQNAKTWYNIDSGIQNFVDGIEHKVYTNPTAYDPEFWQFKLMPRKKKVITVGFADDKRRIRIKGLDNFVALALELPDFEFQLIGVDLDIINKYLELPKNMEVVGKCSKEQLRDYYNEAYFYAQLSRIEGLPNVVCEAMLCGCYPVGNDVFGIRSLVENNGLLMKNDDVKILAQKMRAVYDKNQVDRKTFRDFIIQNYSIEKRIHSFLDRLQKAN